MILKYSFKQGTSYYTSTTTTRQINFKFDAARGTHMGRKSRKSLFDLDPHPYGKGVDFLQTVYTKSIEFKYKRCSSFK